MKKTITTITLAMVMAFGTIFANAGIIIEKADDTSKGCTDSKVDVLTGIIIEGFGIIIEGKTGIIIEGKSEPVVKCSSVVKNGIIIEG